MASDRLQSQIERLLDQAEAAIAELDWATVGDRARAVLGLDADKPDGLAYLAAAQRALESLDISPSGVTPPTLPASVPAPALDQPTSFANGRYQVQRFLGEGGKKKVYLAHDTLLDRDVAFALIKTEGLDETSRSRISREAQAMGRLGSHQHIVTVFDLGQEQDQPYMVTELMGGGDVEGIIENAGDNRIPLERSVEVAKETCRGLEFAHGRGIIHRDLKPGNVWLTEEGTAKIGDFGLAVALDRSRLTSEGMMVGTVSYMPPEQAMGGEVTPRSDLYSLGAMLYEMVTGRPPFLGDDSVAIIGQHINTPPVAPTWHNGQCPRPLARIHRRTPMDGVRIAAGWVRELQGRWLGSIGVDWRSADGLQSPHRAPMALCGSCDARDGERIRSRELSRTGVARVCGEVGSVAGWQSGGEWNGSQSGHGASELGFPRPMLGKMQGKAARRAGDSSHQSEEPPPEGFGGRDPFTQADAGCPAGQVVRHHLYRQPGAVGGEAPRGHVVQPDAVLEVAYRILDLGVAAMISLQFQHLPIPVGDEAVIAVGGEEGELGTGRGLHPPDDEPHRRGVGFTLEGGIGGLGHIGGAVHPVGNRRPVLLGDRLDQLPQAFVLADGDGEADTHFAADGDESVGIEAAVGAHRELAALAPP